MKAIRNKKSPPTANRIRTEAEQAHSFVQECEPAVSGQGGHNQLYKVVCKMVRSNITLKEIWEWVRDYNTRCKPPWSKPELIHKVVDAYKTVGIHYCETDLMVALPFEETDETSLADGDFTVPAASKTLAPRAKPNRDGFGPGTQDQLQQLSSLRRISIPGLRWAQDRGVLVFGYFAGLSVYGVTDSSGAVLEIRRLDGKIFPAVGNLSERKSHAIRGSSKRWPVGILEARDASHIIVMEGIPDFLTAHDLILREQSKGSIAAVTPCAPVAMLSANVAIDDVARPIFKGKFVRIFYHNDASGAGWKGARRWQQQIIEAGAFSCDFFHFNKIITAAVKDLNDYVVAMDAGQIASDHQALGGFCS